MDYYILNNYNTFYSFIKIFIQNAKEDQKKIFVKNMKEINSKKCIYDTHYNLGIEINKLYDFY